MPRLHHYTASLLLAWAAAVQAGAVELGEARVNSYIGQQLTADIELTSLQDGAGSVQVHLASRDVYQGAGIDMPAVLSSLNMNVMRRDGKQFLHLTSLKPVVADHLHVYLELTEGGRKSVRLATLWFTPDPTPPAPVTAPVSLPLAAREPTPPPLAWAKPKPARQPAVSLPKPQPEAACRREPSKAEAVCAALDGKNAELQAKLILLEGRVQALQAEAQAAAAPEPPDTAKQPEPTAKKEAAAGQESASDKFNQPAEPSADAHPPKPAPAAAAAPVVKKPQPPESEMPWGWIAGAGAAVFAAVGGWQFWRSRRKGAKAKPVKRVEPSEEKADSAEEAEPVLE